MRINCKNRNYYDNRWYWRYIGCSSANGDDSGSSNISDNIYCSYISINFRTILIICCLIDLITTKDITEQRLGCNLLDHQVCDELCKQDSYWYGYCSVWDGHNFTCSCHQYNLPLNGNLCKRIQQICNEYCIKRGLEGGYCYVYATTTAPNGKTECKCFEELMQSVE